MALIKRLRAWFKKAPQTFKLGRRGDFWVRICDDVMSSDYGDVIEVFVDRKWAALSQIDNLFVRASIKGTVP
jgi:hypothetical protein